jgi:hypothetical protein
MTKRKWITAEELMSQLDHDPNYRRGVDEKNRKEQDRAARDAALELPILQKLRALGFVGDSIWDLTEKYCPLPQQLAEVLLDEVRRLTSQISRYSDYYSSTEVRVLDALIRGLAAAASPFDGRPLVKCYETTRDPSLRWVIANTIASARPHSIDDWIEKALKEPWLAKTLRDLGYGKSKRKKQ